MSKKQIIIIFIAVAVVLLFVGGGIISGMFNINTKTEMSNNEESKVQAQNQDLTQVQIQDSTVGQGDEAVIGKTVTVNYTGIFTDGKKFDSSLDRGVPFSFKLGSGMVIKGWDIGIQGMKVGGKRILVIPPEFGYGANDYGPIPGNSTLVFEVDLLKVE